MNIYNKKTINNKPIFEDDIIHFKMDEDKAYRLGKVVFDCDWMLIDIEAKKAIKMDIAHKYYNLITYKE